MIEVIIAIVSILLVILGVTWYAMRNNMGLTINEETRKSEINVRRRQ